MRFRPFGHFVSFSTVKAVGKCRTLLSPFQTEVSVLTGKARLWQAAFKSEAGLFGLYLNPGYPEEFGYHSSMTTPQPVQKKHGTTLLLGVSVTIAVACFFFCTRRSDFGRHSVVHEEVSVPAVATDPVQPLAADHRMKTPTASGTKTETAATSKPIVELLRTDDLCGLDRKFSRVDGEDEATRKKRQNQIEEEYFGASSFKDGFKDYRDSMGGMLTSSGREFSRYPRFLAALRRADWVDPSPQVAPYLNFVTATRELIRLAYEDRGNAAPAAFALAVSQLIPDKTELTNGERDEILALLESATRFDSYLVGFARDISNIEDNRAVSLTIRVAFLANVAIPNWNKFKTEFIKATEDKVDIRLKVTDLMIAGAKEAKSPSYALGYSIMDSAFAKAIAGGARRYPTFTEIDAAFPGHLKKSVNDIFALLFEGDGKTCNESHVQKIRDYMSELKKTDSALGIAL